MPRKKEPEPNRLLASDVVILAYDHKVGILELTTDEGLIPIAINVGVAADLAALLIDFLAAREDEGEEAANDA